MSSSFHFDKLQRFVADAQNFESLTRTLGAQIAGTIRAIASAASPDEWNRFVESGFDQRALPPIALGRRDLETLKGGRLARLREPAVMQELRALAERAG